MLVALGLPSAPSSNLALGQDWLLGPLEGRAALVIEARKQSVRSAQPEEDPLVAVGTPQIGPAYAAVARGHAAALLPLLPGRPAQASCFTPIPRCNGPPAA